MSAAVSPQIRSRVSAPAGTSTGTIYFLQILRGLAAVFVMLFHYRGFLNGVYGQQDLGTLLFGQGYMGVDLFFIVSGFIIVYSTSRTEHANWIDFLIRRFFRVVPLAWLATLAFYFLDGGKFESGTLLKSLAFIPLENSNPPFLGYSLYAIVWTLNYEVLFYAIFTVALLLSHRFRTLLATALIAFSLYVFQSLLTGHVSLDAMRVALPDFSLTWFPVQLFGLLGNPILLEFAVGMVLGELYLRYSSRLSALPPFVVRLFAFALFGVFLYYYFSPIGGGHGLTNKGPGAIALACAALLVETSLRGQMPAPGVWFFVGAMTYTLYLVHNGITDRFLKRIPWLYAELSKPGLPQLLASVWISLVAAAIAHKLIELPLQDLGKRIIRARRARPHGETAERRGRSRWLRPVMVTICCVAALGVATGARHLHRVQSANLVTTNPSFETGIAGWNRGTATTFESTDAVAVDGRRSAHVVTGGMQFIELGGITVNKTNRLRIEVWVYVKRGYVRLELLDGRRPALLAEAHMKETPGWYLLSVATEGAVGTDMVTVNIDDYHQASEFFIDSLRLRPQW